MARKVIWTDPAVSDLEDALEYIARDSPAYAATLAQATCDAGDSLAVFSERGHRFADPELRSYRAIHVGSYHLIYSVEPKRVVIHAFLHGRRDLPIALRPRVRRK